MVFSKPKDEVLETYAIVKGGIDLLDKDTRSKFVGLRETSVGFEGLINDMDNSRKVFGDKVLIERATLEDIMVYTVRR